MKNAGTNIENQDKCEKIRICHVISDGGVGGAGVLLCNLLSRLDREKISSVVFLPRSSALIPRLRETGVPIVAQDFVPDRSFSLRGMMKLRSFLRQHPCDIVHTHGACFGRMAAKGVNTLAVNTRHCDTKMKTPLYNFVTDFTVATSENMLLGMGKIPAQKRLFIPNGSARQQRFDVNKRLQIKRRLGIPDSALVAGFVGRLEKIKGCDVFLRGAALAASLDESLYFVVVGDGTERENLRRLTDELGVRDRVIFCGYSDKAWEYMNVFDMGVNSSLGSETSPLALSEMMSLGIPIVASDIPGNRYMLKGDAGLLFPCGDAYSLSASLCELCADKQARIKYGEAAKRRYEREFSLEKMTASYEQLYARLVNT